MQQGTIEFQEVKPLACGFAHPRNLLCCGFKRHFAHLHAASTMLWSDADNICLARGELEHPLAAAANVEWWMRLLEWQRSVVQIGRGIIRPGERTLWLCQTVLDEPDSFLKATDVGSCILKRPIW